MGRAESKSIFADEKGMALLLTIMIVSLLAGITMMFHRDSWHGYRMADSYKKTGQLKSIADSGINIGMELLFKRSGADPFDSLLDGWATLKKDMFVSLFDDGQLELVISDLSGRLQVNSLVEGGRAAGKKKTAGKNNGQSTAKELREIFYRLLLSGEFAIRDESEARDIVDALVDWMDRDDNESNYGAESSYYRALNPPYECRNGPVDTIDELLLVKGITAELLYGDGEKKGLADFITVCGSGTRMNINTMDPLLVRSMNPLITRKLAISFDEFRKNRTNRDLLADPSWYKKVATWPGDVVLNEKLLTTKSSCFLLHSTGKNMSRSYSVIVVVRRKEDGEMELVHRKVE